jgi:putative oxidoreductase
MVGGWPVDMIILIGRILFVAIFLASGVAHLTQTRDMEGYVVS